MASPTTTDEPREMNGPAGNGIDRHDLEAMEKWVAAEFRGLGERLVGMQRALETARQEAKDRDDLAREEAKDKAERLNNVYHRFLDKSTFEGYVTAQSNERKAEKSERERQRKAALFAFAGMGIAIAAVAVPVLAR